MHERNDTSDYYPDAPEKEPPPSDAPDGKGGATVADLIRQCMLEEEKRDMEIELEKIRLESQSAARIQMSERIIAFMFEQFAPEVEESLSFDEVDDLLKKNGALLEAVIAVINDCGTFSEVLSERRKTIQELLARMDTTLREINTKDVPKTLGSWIVHILPKKFGNAEEVAATTQTENAFRRLRTQVARLLCAEQTSVALLLLEGRNSHARDFFRFVAYQYNMSSRELAAALFFRACSKKYAPENAS